jgi:hypothetical protein
MLQLKLVLFHYLQYTYTTTTFESPTQLISCAPTWLYTYSIVAASWPSQPAILHVLNPKHQLVPL